LKYEYELQTQNYKPLIRNEGEPDFKYFTLISHNMIKNKISLLIGSLIFVLGLIFKFSDIIGAGTLMALGLIVVIIISSINLAYFENKKVKEYLIYFSVIFISTIIFTLIQHRLFFEIFAGGLIVGMISFFIAYLIKKLK